MVEDVKQDAREFGLHVKQGGWRLGLLVARSVEKGSGQSERGSRHNDCYDEKVSAQKFATLSGTSAPRVLRYLDAWNRAAEAGHVPVPADLVPGEEIDLNVNSLPDWGEYYDASNAGGRPRLTTAEKAQIIEQAREDALSDPDFVSQVIASNPDAVIEAVASDPDALTQAVEQRRSGGVTGGHTRVDDGIFDVPPIDERWMKWLNQLNGVLLQGARLADETKADELKGYAALAHALYLKFSETQISAEMRNLDDEIRSLLDHEGR